MIPSRKPTYLISYLGKMKIIHPLILKSTLGGYIIRTIPRRVPSIYMDLPELSPSKTQLLVFHSLSHPWVFLPLWNLFRPVDGLWSLYGWLEAPGLKSRGFCFCFFSKRRSEGKIYTWNPKQPVLNGWKWWNNHFLYKDLESSNWNNHFKVDVSGSRYKSFV